jgi:hypothetical protein
MLHERTGRNTSPSPFRRQQRRDGEPLLPERPARDVLPGKRCWGRTALGGAELRTTPLHPRNRRARWCISCYCCARRCGAPGVHRDDEAMECVRLHRRRQRGASTDGPRANVRGPSCLGSRGHTARTRIREHAGTPVALRRERRGSADGSRDTVRVVAAAGHQHERTGPGALCVRVSVVSPPRTSGTGRRRPDVGAQRG